MRTEKSQPKDKQIMLEMRFTEFPALSVDQGFGFLSLQDRQMINEFSYILLEK